MAENTKGANTLGRLNDVLFAELERLNDVDVGDKDAMKAEIERSKAVQGVAREINASASTILAHTELRARLHGINMTTPKMLEG